MPRPPGKTIKSKHNGSVISVSIGDKEVREYGGVPHFKCSGGLHSKGKWLPYSEFPIQAAYRRRITQYFFRSICKKCYSDYRQKQKKQTKDYTNHGLVPLKEMRPFLHELVKRCGGFRPAARTVGVDYITMLRWCGRIEERRFMHKEHATKVLSTLAGLRNGTITPDRKRKPLRGLKVI